MIYSSITQLGSSHFYLLTPGSVDFFDRLASNFSFSFICLLFIHLPLWSPAFQFSNQDMTEQTGLDLRFYFRKSNDPPTWQVRTLFEANEHHKTNRLQPRALKYSVKLNFLWLIFIILTELKIYCTKRLLCFLSKLFSTVIVC